MLPAFGTNLYQYIFEPLTDETMAKIENEINDAVERFIPNLKVNKVNVLQLGDEGFGAMDKNDPFRIKITLDYSIQQKAFEFRDSVEIEF